MRRVRRMVTLLVVGLGLAASVTAASLMLRPPEPMKSLLGRWECTDGGEVLALDRRWAHTPGGAVRWSVTPQILRIGRDSYEWQLSADGQNLTLHPDDPSGSHQEVEINYRRR
jgi:hypothetical protein